MNPLRVAIAQDHPVFLDPVATTELIIDRLESAAAAGVRLLCFGEVFLSGYPCWLSPTWGARFEDPTIKACYAAYLEAAVESTGAELKRIEIACRELDIAAVLGFSERERGTVYCSALFFHPERGRSRIHRKLVPTYEERLVWGHGDAHGLVIHELDGWRVSLLNCWENWMPLARAALWAQGADLHVALWPGSDGLTRPIGRFLAREGRCYAVSACALLDASKIPADFPLAAELSGRGFLQNGGSAIAGPEGEWRLEPVIETVAMPILELDQRACLEERTSFDPAGHYSRPELLQLKVDRRRSSACFSED